MALEKLIVALSLAATASAGSAARQDAPAPAVAPAGTEQTRYCMRIEAVTGSRIEEIRCWTRVEWAEQGVDVDREWAEEGVRVLG